MAGFGSHPHVHRHLLEFTEEVPDGGHNLVKGRERLLPKYNKREFFMSLCWNGISSNLIWEVLKSPETPGDHPGKQKEGRLGRASVFFPETRALTRLSA